MKFVLHPWQLLLLALAAWLNRQQQQTMEYLITENQILKEKLGKKRILLSDDQRRRLARQGQGPGAQAATADREHCLSRHDPSVAQSTHCRKVGLQPSTQEGWTAPDRKRTRQVSGPHG